MSFTSWKTIKIFSRCKCLSTITIPGTNKGSRKNKYSLHIKTTKGKYKVILFQSGNTVHMLCMCGVSVTCNTQCCISVRCATWRGSESVGCAVLTCAVRVAPRAAPLILFSVLHRLSWGSLTPSLDTCTLLSPYPFYPSLNPLPYGNHQFVLHCRVLSAHGRRMRAKQVSCEGKGAGDEKGSRGRERDSRNDCLLGQPLSLLFVRK